MAQSIQREIVSDELFRRLWEAGVKIADIAEISKVSKPAVSNRARELGLKARASMERRATRNLSKPKPGPRDPNREASFLDRFDPLIVDLVRQSRGKYEKLAKIAEEHGVDYHRLMIIWQNVR